MKYKGYEFQWELSKNDKKFIDHLVKNDFKILEHKQYISKTKFTLEKDDIEFKYEIYSEISDMQGYLKGFDRAFETHKKYIALCLKESERGED